MGRCWLCVEALLTSPDASLSPQHRVDGVIPRPDPMLLTGCRWRPHSSQCHPPFPTRRRSPRTDVLLNPPQQADALFAFPVIPLCSRQRVRDP